MFTRVTQAIGFLGAMAFTLRGRILFDRIMREVNLNATPKDRIPSFSWTYPGDIIKRHKQLYPESNLRRQMRLCGIVAAAFFLLLMGSWLI